MCSLSFMAIPHRRCLLNAVSYENGYVLDCEVLVCEMHSFGQACSVTIPMNINPQ